MENWRDNPSAELFAMCRNLRRRLLDCQCNRMQLNTALNFMFEATSPMAEVRALPFFVLEGPEA